MYAVIMGVYKITRKYAYDVGQKNDAILIVVERNTRRSAAQIVCLLLKLMTTFTFCLAPAVEYKNGHFYQVLVSDLLVQNLGFGWLNKRVCFHYGNTLK